MPILRGVPAEVKLACLRVVEPGIAFLLILEKAFQLLPQPRDLRLVLDNRAQKRTDGFRGSGGKVGVVDEHHHDHTLVEDVQDLLLRGVVAERSQGTVEMVPAVLRRSHDVGLEVIASRDDPSLGLKRLPDCFPFVPAEGALQFVPLDVHGQGAEALAGGQVQEVSQQIPGAELGVALILAQALDQVSQVCQCLLAGKKGGVAGAGDDVREQLHELADGGQLGERAEIKPVCRVLVPALERIARDGVDHPVLGSEVTHRV